uniref:ribonuclease H n=1 Tax=Oryzias latipes TaxID=8090 RepID=A0A3B3I1M0_ORYLA
MDTSESERLLAALGTQGQRITQQDQQLAQLRHDFATAMSSLSTQLSDVTTALQNRTVSECSSSVTPSAPSETATTPPGPSEPRPVRLSSPERFSGDSGDCRSFLTQCELHFEFQSHAFPSDRAKIAYIVSYLSGRAKAWATSEWSRRSAVCNSLPLFLETFRQIFHSAVPGREAAKALVNIKQGRRSVMDYAIEFRTLSADSGWNQPALVDAFYTGLSERLKDHLAPLDLPPELDALVSLASRIDQRLQERQRGRLSAPLSRPPSLPYAPELQPSCSGAVPPPDAVEPMQVGHTRLTPAERQRRFSEGRCLYCAQLGHLIANCPIRGAVSTNTSSVMVSATQSRISVPRQLTQVTLTTDTSTSAQGALLDSGADTNLMSYELASKLHIKEVEMSVPLTATALDGRLLCYITHKTPPVTLSFPDGHSELITFHLFRSAAHPLILGFPWLLRHNPHIDWSMGTVKSWGKSCFNDCFPVSPNLNPDDTPDLEGVPRCYHDLKDVFNKCYATSLPPHRDGDCAIDLLPGAPIPKGRLFSLSIPERLAMEEYIKTSLRAGLIRPSSSPAGAGFFFVEKKDKTLRPCIDYTQLNDITIKNRYPLPLVSSAFDILQGAKIFTKLDLRNAYHLIRIREGDEWKTAFNTPIGHYEYLVMPGGPPPSCRNRKWGFKKKKTFHCGSASHVLKEGRETETDFSWF